MSERRTYGHDREGRWETLVEATWLEDGTIRAAVVQIDHADTTLSGEEEKP